MKKVSAILLVMVFIMPAGLLARLSFADFHGTWRLMYRGNYGYEFSFNKSYRANCIIFLQHSTLRFRGVYTLDEQNRLRINLSDMKHQEHGTSAKFTRLGSSYFIFNAEKGKSSGGEYLELRPVTIIINGQNSEGYFEPVIKLSK